ncbi:MAG: LysR family transcriptional regulator [Alteromonadaceae bacterium]|uniref:LysR substrate-binding domain-containing protein n=1 Tax=Marinobacter sp. BGYM27 TaxID=2975597 RepID=UPI000C568C65|nr:LysR substrate-binding domain-containing protein [Marinobacter sp. BGYM27]MAA65451.1 LysR family transcriptional regulator [Alteromonadaceae bacterium]MBH86872.1 LysR family transcriptional regulator [Alteromonadaceae bacterium]MDG5501245.1 LysR substrate-binding domain-containing protein [Marinobacter sp. BGYM27]|tara:strand:- start:22620 stop:23525 length:906 start_codon:yes stop_codon:yes gene_type:complete
MGSTAPLIPPQSLPLLETDVLRTFVAIAETASFSRAARQVFRTTSAVSMQIKKLEEMLGQPLFLREARRVTLTPAGETLLRYSRRLLKLNDEAVSEFLKPSLAGTVRFGTPDDIGTRILPGVLADFARSYPAVEVDVVVSSSQTLLKRLDDGELDLVLITAGSADDKTADGTVVHTEPLVWAERDGGTALERHPLPIAFASPGCAWRSTALAALDRAGLAYRIAYTSEHCAGQQAAMEADLAIAPFPLGLIRKPIRQVATSAGLPSLGHYQIEMRSGAHRNEVVEALSGYVVRAFEIMRGD